MNATVLSARKSVVNDFSSAPTTCNWARPWVARLHRRARRGVFELLPVAAIEHVAIVLEAEFSGRRPARPGGAVQVPLAGIAGGVTVPTQHLGECHDVTRIGRSLMAAPVFCG